MRMTWIAAALVLASSPSLDAQEAAPATAKVKKIHWSLMGGATFTTMTGIAADTANLSSRIGGVGAIGLEYMLSPSVSLGVEAMLLQKGAKQPTVTNRPGLGYRMLYLEVPLLLRWNLSAASKGLQPVIVLGPSIGWEMDCKMPFLYVNSVISSTCYALAPIARETMDVSGNVGFELHKGKWYLTGRYMKGFTNLLSGPGAPDLKNSGFLAGLGIRF